jgi:hypothetical protein
VFTPGFCGIRVAHIVSFLCCVVFTPGFWWDPCCPYCWFSLLCCAYPRVLVGSVLPILLVFSVGLCLPPVFGGICVAHIVSFLCCVVFTPGFWWDPCCPYC